MRELARVVSVEHLGGLRLRLTFTDGLVRELDFGGSLVDGVLDGLNDPGVFSRVSVDEVSGTITWPGGIDLDPDVLHGDHPPATGRPPRVISEYRLNSTA